MPRLVEIHDKFSPQGLQILAVTADNPNLVPDYIDDHDISYGVVSTRRMHGNWGIRSIPYAVLVDPAGQVVWVGHPGRLTDEYLSSKLAANSGGSVSDIGGGNRNSKLWLLGLGLAFLFFVGAVGSFWWKTRTPRWKPDYSAYAPQQEQIPVESSGFDDADDGNIGAAQKVHVGQTREFAKSEIVSRVELNQKPGPEHMGGGSVNPGNTTSTPGTDMYPRPSTGSMPVVRSNPHSKPRLDRSNSHLSAGSEPQPPVSKPQTRPSLGSNTQMRPNPTHSLAPQPTTLNTEPRQKQPNKGKTQFRPYDPTANGG